MVVVMAPDATQQDMDGIVELVRGAGGEAFITRGVSRTIVGLVGDVDQFGALNLRSMPGVSDVVRISVPYKLVSREHHPNRSVVRVGGVPIGPDTLTVIAGPCAVESPEQALTAARMARAAGASLLRGGAFKPRTSPYAYQGLGEAGLKILAEVGQETGLPTVTEVIDPRDVDLVCDHADMLQVGTRNMQNFALLQAVGSAGKPVLLKRGLLGHHRGVADGGRVHRAARQPGHRAVRAGHPHVREGHPQHARHLRGSGRPAAVPPAGHRRPVALRRPPRSGAAADPGRHRGRRGRADHRRAPGARPRRCATATRPCSTPTSANWPPSRRTCRR